MDAFLTSAADDPAFAERMAGVPQLFFAADPQAMSMLVGDIERAHGSVRRFVQALGVEDAALASLEEQLLD